MAVQERLLAANNAAVRASVIRVLSHKSAMNELDAATLLQVKWRKFRAQRTKNLWKKIHALEEKKKMEKGSGGSDDQKAQEPIIYEGWERRTNRMTGEVYLFHSAIGKSQWEKPGDA